MAKEAKSKAPKEAKNSKDKRHFWKDFKAELKRVIWPTPKQLVNNTVAVLSIVLLTAVIVFVLDLGFEFLTKNGIDSLKKLVTQTENNVVDNGNLAENNTVEDNTIAENNTVNDNTTIEGQENVTE